MSQEDGQLLAITQREIDGRFHVWVIEHGCVFDPTRPLTGRLEAPELSVREGAWQRQGRGQVSLRLERHGSHYAVGTGGSNPLEATSVSHLTTLVLHASEDAVASWREQWCRHDDGERFSSPLLSMLEAAEENIELAWLQRERELARERFLRGGRAEDWAAAAEKLALRFPHGRNRVGFMDAHGRPVWLRALEVALESGVWLEGMTVGQMFQVALNAGLRGGYVPVAGRGGNWKEWSADAVPTLEEDLGDLAISLQARTEPATEPESAGPEPPADEVDAGAEQEAQRLADELLERMADAIRPEPKPTDDVLLERDEGDVLGPE